MNYYVHKLTACSLCFLLYGIGVEQNLYSQEWSQYSQNPHVIKLAPSQKTMSRRGGIIVSDINSDGLLDFILTTKEHDYGDKGRATIGVYDHDGDILWVDRNADININGNAEYHGLPGWHGPGISATDFDGDGKREIIYLSLKNEIVIRNGFDGTPIKRIDVALPDEGVMDLGTLIFDIFYHSTTKRAIKTLMSTPKRWAHFQVVRLTGTLDDEVILQADPLPFRWLKAVSLTSGKTLWDYHRYFGQQHAGFRAADIDGDGFDEIIGGEVIDHDGTLFQTWRYRKIPGHLDALYIADVRPDIPGIEWVITEESHDGDDRTMLAGKNKVFFYHSFHGEEPQNAAIGNFDRTRPGLEIWCRSRHNKNQTPWVIDAEGNTIAQYKINDHKPEAWSDSGIEVISAIDWNGNGSHLLAAKERHTIGKICLLDPLKGTFLHVWEEHAARIYVVDVSGDYREEIVVVNPEEHEIRVYWNSEKNPDYSPEKKRLWSDQHYRRQKLNYNYYSP